MYVWVIGKAIPTPKNNMYGSFEFEQASMLARHGLKVVYIGLDFRPIHRWRRWGVHEEQVGEMIAYELDLPIRPIPILQNKVEWCFCKKLYREIEQKHGLPDIIHVHFPALRSYCIHEEYQMRGVKIIATEHWTQVQKQNIPNLYGENLKWFVENSDAFVCVGEPLKKSVIEYTKTGKEILVIPNIINQEFRFALPAKKDHFTFIGVGRLAPVKRFDLTIEAFTKAFRGNEAVELVIVGGGEEYNKLNEQIKSLGMEKQIHLRGVLPREETAIEVQKSDALVCASNYETFGVPVIEAWACGKPVIETDSVGYLEYMNEDLGYVVEHDNISQMIDAMKKLYERRNEFDSKYISDYANSNFGEDAIAAKLIKVYKGVLKGGKV